MDITDETLMAFADGELDPAQRAQVEAAIASNPAFARRVAQFRAQRAQLVAALAPQLAEAVPDRLLAAVRGTAASRQGNVVELSERRMTRRVAERIRQLSWSELGAIAASLVVAVLVGAEALRDDGHAVIRMTAGGLVADRQVAEALTSQLGGSEPADARVHVGISFVDRRGDLCRAFVARGTAGVAGIACHERGEWRIGVAEPIANPVAPSGSMRMAQAEIPASVMQAVEDRISGEPLDAAAERAARDAGWRRPAK